jgi:hypothetical protein
MGILIKSGRSWEKIGPKWVKIVTERGQFSAHLLGLLQCCIMFQQDERLTATTEQ